MNKKELDSTKSEIISLFVIGIGFLILAIFIKHPSTFLSLIQDTGVFNIGDKGNRVIFATFGVYFTGGGIFKLIKFKK